MAQAMPITLENIQRSILSQLEQEMPNDSSSTVPIDLDILDDAQRAVQQQLTVITNDASDKILAKMLMDLTDDLEQNDILNHLR
jgi:hypothetical protein